MAQVLTHQNLLKAIQEQVRFARARFGQYDLIDFVVVLISYVVSGEPTLLAFYERLAPWASPFMALFGRDRLPHRSTLSRFLAALDAEAVEALRALFQKDVLAHNPFPSPGGLFDRIGRQWLVVDVDGTRHSYTGVLVIVAGLGLMIGNWASVLVIVAGLFFPLLYRMSIEEHEMSEAFEEYAQYMSRTKWRLIPFIF